MSGLRCFPQFLLAHSHREQGGLGARHLLPVGGACALGYGLTLSRRLHDVGLRGSHCHAASVGSVGLCIGLWIRAKTVDQDERGNAERRALFVGLSPPMFWLIGDTLDRHEQRRLRLPWNS